MSKKYLVVVLEAESKDKEEFCKNCPVNIKKSYKGIYSYIEAQNIMELYHHLKISRDKFKRAKILMFLQLLLKLLI